ncbi:MAG TPA: hypothetical protein VF654_03070 [Pyrinomonadaceae bacterium]
MSEAPEGFGAARASGREPDGVGRPRRDFDSQPPRGPVVVGPRRGTPVEQHALRALREPEEFVEFTLVP